MNVWDLTLYNLELLPHPNFFRKWNFIFFPVKSNFKNAPWKIGRAGVDYYVSMRNAHAI